MPLYSLPPCRSFTSFIPLLLIDPISSSRYQPLGILGVLQQSQISFFNERESALKSIIFLLVFKYTILKLGISASCPQHARDFKGCSLIFHSLSIQLISAGGNPMYVNKNLYVDTLFNISLSEQVIYYPLFYSEIQFLTFDQQPNLLRKIKDGLSFTVMLIRCLTLPLAITTTALLFHYTFTPYYRYLTC